VLHGQTKVSAHRTASTALGNRQDRVASGIENLTGCTFTSFTPSVSQKARGFGIRRARAGRPSVPCYNAGPVNKDASMTISMYQASVPVFIRMLTNLKRILGKAAAHAQAKKIDESVLLNARLYPDMFPLVKQVHIATDFARGTGARLSGNEPPSYEDKETSSNCAHASRRSRASSRRSSPRTSPVPTSGRSRCRGCRASG
jgi:hypothetical protein